MSLQLTEQLIYIVLGVITQMVPQFKGERKQDLLQIHALIGDFRCNCFNSWRLKCQKLHLNIPQVSLKILYIQVDHHIFKKQYIYT